MMGHVEVVSLLCSCCWFLSARICPIKSQLESMLRITLVAVHLYYSVHSLVTCLVVRMATLQRAPFEDMDNPSSTSSRILAGYGGGDGGAHNNSDDNERSSLLTSWAASRKGFTIWSNTGSANGLGLDDSNDEAFGQNRMRRTICLIATLIGALLTTALIAIVLLAVHGQTASSFDDSTAATGNNDSSFPSSMISPLPSSSITDHVNNEGMEFVSNDNLLPILTTPVISGSLNRPPTMKDVINGTLTPLSSMTMARLRRWWRHQVSLVDDSVSSLVSSMGRLVGFASDESLKWSTNRCRGRHYDTAGFYYDPWRNLYWTNDQHSIVIPDLQLGLLHLQSLPTLHSLECYYFCHR
jgi:hypothetical protein